jgi:hypothetical protein
MLTHFREEEAMEKTIGLGLIKRMPCPFTVLRLFVILITLVICPCIISAATFDQNSATLTNEYFPMKSGDKLTYKTYGFSLLSFEYIEAIKQETIDQVTCLKIKLSSSYSATEFYYYWLAEDTSGNIWVFKFHDVESNDLRYYGRNGAKLVMPSKVNVGSILWNIDIPEKVVATAVTVPKLINGFGPYYNCIKSKIDYGDGDIDYYYYAPDIGQIKCEFNDYGEINGYEISKIRHKPKSIPWLPLLLND